MSKAIRLDPEQLESFKEELLRTLIPERTPSKTLAELAKEWLPRKLRKIPASAKSFEARVRLHLLPALGHHTSATIKPRDVEALLDALVAKGQSPQSANHVRDGGRQLVKDATLNGEWHGPNPFEFCRKLHIPESDFDVLSRTEAGVLLQYGIRPHWRPLFAVALYLGQRRGTIRHIRPEDVHLDTKTIDFRVTKTGKKNLGVPIPDECLPYLEEAIRVCRSEWLFSTRTGRQLCSTSHVLNKELARAMERVNIVRRGGEAPRITFHGLRRCSSCLHQEAGAHPWVCSKALGHSQASLALFGSVTENMTARRYSTYSQDFIRTELNKLSLDLKGFVPMVMRPAPRNPGGPKQPATGTKNGRAKLKPHEVREIRAAWSSTGVAELARYYGVSQRAIRKAAEGLTWRPA